MEYIRKEHAEGFSPMQLKRMNEILAEELPEEPCSAQVASYIHWIMSRNHAAMNDLIIEALRAHYSWERILELCMENQHLYALVSGENIV